MSDVTPWPPSAAVTRRPVSIPTLLGSRVVRSTVVRALNVEAPSPIIR